MTTSSVLPVLLLVGSAAGALVGRGSGLGAPIAPSHSFNKYQTSSHRDGSMLISSCMRTTARNHQQVRLMTCSFIDSSAPEYPRACRAMMNANNDEETGDKVGGGDEPRGFGEARGFGSPSGFASWQEDEVRAERKESQRSIDAAQVAEMKTRIMGGWARFLQEAGASRSDDDEPPIAEFRNVSVALGGRLVLAPQSWAVYEGQRIGVLGESGCGKSLQLALLAGRMEPSSGEVYVQEGLRFELVEQEAIAPLMSSSQLLKDFIAEQSSLPSHSEATRDHVGVAEAQGDEADANYNDGDDADDEDISDIFDDDDGDDGDGDGDELAPPSADAIWSKLLSELPNGAASLEMPLSALSPGQLVRVTVAAALGRAPEMLLLDEPTNHLDLDSIDWLERAVLASGCSLVVVSHDRDTLERLSTHTLNAAGGGGELFGGSYSFFRKAMAAQDVAASLTPDGATERNALPERYRPSRFMFTQEFRSAKKRGQVLALPLLQIDQATIAFSDAAAQHGVHDSATELSAPSKEEREGPPDIDVAVQTDAAGARSGGDGHAIVGLNGVNLHVQRGEVVLLSGINGAGKSTLLRAALGEHPLRAGTAALSSDARPFYFTQDAAYRLQGDESAMEWLVAKCAHAPIEATRRVLKRVGFPVEAQTKRVGVLSGGEKARLVIASMLLGDANLLILDEPTNHLDLQAREYLEAAVNAFDGGVLLVSHDGYFAAQVSTRVCEIVGERVHDTGLAFREYAAARRELEAKLQRRRVSERSALSGLQPPSETQKRKRRAKDRLLSRAAADAVADSRPQGKPERRVLSRRTTMKRKAAKQRAPKLDASLTAVGSHETA